MNRHLLTFAAAVALTAGWPTYAHHSRAGLDLDKVVTFEGTVKEFRWTNPHMFLQMMVTGVDNIAEEWSVECGTPNVNARHGWKRDDFKPGDKVMMEIYPLRDGLRGGNLIKATLADGRVLMGPGEYSRSLTP